MPTYKERRIPTRSGQQYFIRTFGCQMNEHDTERIAGLLESDGMEPAGSADAADLIILNTCTIRENADQKLYGYLGSLRALKSERPLRIAVGGCMAQKDREVIQDRAGWVDVVFGTHNTHRVLDLLDHADEWGPITEIWEETTSTEAMPSALPTHRETPHSAWVTITIGCNNSCTFCIVPYVRGAEISRRPSDIIREVRNLVAEGVREVTLLGQNVNSYGRDLDLNGRKPLFADLLRQVGQVEGLRRIRFTSPHPKDIRADVAAAMAETPEVCEQLHFPLQSGSDSVLRRMHRGYTGERFLARLEMVRSHMPDLTVSTDIIVGFPGETEADFQDTLDVVAAARFDSAYMFQYSPRPGTPAAEYDDQLSKEVVQERFDRLAALQDQISLEKNEALLGSTLELMSEGPSRKDASRLAGRTRGGKVVHCEASVPPGEELFATITSAAPHHLMGVPAS
ncbi:MAG: tRNA (N6-isopentenyl adenosine(37)-C2)-methylthiotransferase MiaB [Acidimicrobiia bacterium]|nr:tRNA (N6-isopentenyl adenosine(37)-C2)-methylthiotransferase MiaB [Acidimicrobiia bacterium]NNF65347.1 tRNA (N6-isopentenyl adenosine(37)-C2)-methylthiotransferase MiaB [Acidimicrobiia bacterium]